MALSNIMAQSQMASNDFQNAQTIGTQIQADAQKQLKRARFPVHEFVAATQR